VLPKLYAAGWTHDQIWKNVGSRMGE